MGLKLKVTLRGVSKAYYIVAIATVIVIVAGGVLWYSSDQQRLNSQPDTGATLRTASLLSTAQEIRNSFGLTPDRYDSRKNSVEYLNSLDQFQEDCQIITRLSDRAKDEDETSSIAQYLAKSNLMCEELMKLSKEGTAITESVLPLLKENAPLKRYENLPFVRDQIRTRHEQKVQTALDQVSDSLKFIEYKTETKQYVVQLSEAMKANSGMTYMSALSAFQQNVYGERQRYWNSEADLGNLIQALNISLDRYCKYLSGKDVILSVCREKT